MQVKVLFDKQALSNKLHTGWGVSFLINNRILFDTGENGQWLIDNMHQMNVEIDKLQAIVISHDHWDHTGGLKEILKKMKLRVYGCPNFSIDFKDKIDYLNSELISLNKITEISQNIYSTGEITGLYAGREIAEQAMVMRTDKGISVLTGCSHPEIIKILTKIKSEFPKEKFYLVAGGFHLIEQDARLVKIIAEDFKNLEVAKVGPTHCTGKEAEDILKDAYKDDFLPIRVGQTIEI
ncbi:MAG: MBL fold metallo-hydrolase [Candidatus Omnitrophota bacterium]|jgi:7,8-dihydropterin-6-yl-methyl-4-(beta-D-ribofuranosyl)aminobenzene 5'-phosphate synthase